MSLSTIVTALALIAEGTEETELVTTVDILRRAGMEVTIAGLDGAGCVKCSRGVKVCPDVALSDVIANDYDIVVLPGGLGGVEKLSKSDAVKQLLKKQEKNNGVIAAICAAPLVLKTHGIALKKKLTSYPSVKNDVVGDGIYTYCEDKVVVDGNLITSRGPGTAIEFALTIIEHAINAETRTKVANQFIA